MSDVILQHYSSTSFKRKEGYKGAFIEPYIAKDTSSDLFIVKTATTQRQTLQPTVTQVDPRGW